MTGIHAIIIVLIRIWAASAIISSLVIAPSYAEIAFTDTTDAFSAIQFAGFVVWLVLGIVAWVVAPWLARRIHTRDEGPDLNTTVDAEMLVAVGSFLIGVFYLAQHLPPILIDWARWLIERAGESPVEESQLGTVKRNVIHWNNFVSDFAIVIVASVMALRPSYLARIFTWLRSPGHAKKSDNGDARVVQE